MCRKLCHLISKAVVLGLNPSEVECAPLPLGRLYPYAATGPLDDLLNDRQTHPGFLRFSLFKALKNFKNLFVVLRVNADLVVSDYALNPLAGVLAGSYRPIPPQDAIKRRFN